MKSEEYNDKLTEFSHLFYAFYAKLHHYAFTILKDNHAAEDIVQTVFLKLWERGDRLLKEEKILGYLYRATYHLCLNHLRNIKTRNIHAKAIAGMQATAVQEEPSASDLSGHIQKVIEALPHRRRIIFLKSRVEGKKYREIATEMGISVKTVEVQIGKALKTFREELRDHLL